MKRKLDQTSDSKILDSNLDSNSKRKKMKTTLSDYSLLKILQLYRDRDRSVNTLKLGQRLNAYFYGENHVKKDSISSMLDELSKSPNYNNIYHVMEQEGLGSLLETMGGNHTVKDSLEIREQRNILKDKLVKIYSNDKNGAYSESFSHIVSPDVNLSPGQSYNNDQRPSTPPNGYFDTYSVNLQPTPLRVIPDNSNDRNKTTSERFSFFNLSSTPQNNTNISMSSTPMYFFDKNGFFQPRPLQDTSNSNEKKLLPSFGELLEKVNNI